MEQTYAMKIVSPDEPDDFMVVGWKVAKNSLRGFAMPIAGLILSTERKKRKRMKRKKRRKMTKRRKKRRK